MSNREHGTRHWRYETDQDGLGWLTADRAGSSSNSLSREVLQELDSLLATIEQEKPKALIIRSAKASGFIVGADVSEFTQLADPTEAGELIQRGQAIMNRIEALPMPTVALINGHCLGGGLELALACDYRIAEESSRLGLPEVMLGIFPGFGGTLRLPRLIGHLAALQMMLAGRTVDARSARRMGLIDYAVPQRQLLRAAAQVALKPPKKHHPVWWQRLIGLLPFRPAVAVLLRRTVSKRVNPKHYPAPYALIEHWLKNGQKAASVLKGEAEAVAKLISGSTAQNLVRVFMLQERLKKEGDKSLFTPKHVHVVGAGVMGGDIASWCALRGMRVTLQDRQEEIVAKAIARAHNLFQKKLKQPRLIQAAMDRLIPDQHGNGIRRADVVIEAIVENVEAKHSLFAELEPQLKEDAILASNTSSIPLEDLAGGLKHPERLVGLHFFNPVAKMQLVEVVHGSQTSEQTMAKASAFVRHIDRLPLPVKSSPGFLVNRVLMPYLLEAVIIESEGVDARVIDKAALDFGMPMGPIRLADTVGLDICLSVANILSKPLNLEVPQKLKALVEAGHLGVKSGQGFYRYEKGKAKAAALNEKVAGPEDLQDRLMLRLINEAIACLREGVVRDDDLIDAGVIFGTGFAPFRGGPLHYLQQSDPEEQRHHLEELQHHYGARFDIDDGWKDHSLFHHGPRQGVA